MVKVTLRYPTIPVNWRSASRNVKCDDVGYIPKWRAPAGTAGDHPESLWVHSRSGCKCRAGQSHSALQEPGVPCGELQGVDDSEDRTPAELAQTAVSLSPMLFGTADPSFPQQAFPVSLPIRSLECCPPAPRLIRSRARRWNEKTSCEIASPSFTRAIAADSCGCSTLVRHRCPCSVRHITIASMAFPTTPAERPAAAATETPYQFDGAIIPRNRCTPSHAAHRIPASAG